MAREPADRDPGDRVRFARLGRHYSSLSVLETRPGKRSAAHGRCGVSPAGGRGRGIAIASRPPAHRIGRAVVLAAAVLALMPLAASAHSTLISSQPMPGQRLSSAPGVVVLDFSEPINIQLSRAQVVTPVGRTFSAAGLSSEEIEVPLSGNEFGVYSVGWTTVSAVDGHVLHGSFVFGVGVSPVGTGEANSAALGLADVLLALARAVEFGALLLAIGVLLIRQLASHAPRLIWVRGRRRRCRRRINIGRGRFEPRRDCDLSERR